MKNSLFKRVSATAVAVPLALTQCLAFTAGAANDEAAKTSETAVTLEDVIAIDAAKKINPIDENATHIGYQTSDWNLLVQGLMTELVGKSGSVNGDKVVELLGKKVKGYEEAVQGILKNNVVSNGITYEVKDENTIEIKATLSEIDFNEPYANTPAATLGKIADDFDAPALKKVDYSEMKVGGDLVITIDMSSLSDKKVKASVVFTSLEGEEYNGTAVLGWAKVKLAKLQETAWKAIEDAIPVLGESQEAKDRFNEDFKLLENKFNKLEDYYESAFSKTASYDSVSDAIAAANKFIASKGYKRQLPTSAEKIAANSRVEGLVDKGNSTLSNIDVQIDAAAVGALIDSLEKKSVECEDEKYETAYNITVDKGVATIVGAFADDQSKEVAEYIESLGYMYVDSYKEFTAKFDATGRATADTAEIEVDIKRIIVTDTTTTTTSTTTATTTETTTTATESTSSSTETTTTATESTTSSTETTTTATESTSSSTETTTTATESTTSSTETTTTVSIPGDVVTTVAVKSVTVELEKQTGFYLNVEDEFDATQIKSAYLHIVYGVGYENEDGTKVEVKAYENVENITDKVGFGSATPANTYKADNATFVYDVNVVYNGEDILDANGNQLLTKGNLLREQDGTLASVEAYIGVKGDATLDNVVDANDASAVLTFYAKTSTEEFDSSNTILSTSELATTPSSVYDDFAAFLCDVKIEVSNKEQFSRYSKKTERLIDAIDASAILTYYAMASTEQYGQMSKEEPSKLWSLVID